MSSPDCPRCGANESAGGYYTCGHCGKEWHAEDTPGPDFEGFARQIARLMLWHESELFKEQVAGGADPEAAQTDLDYLTSQDEALQSLIHKARKLCGMTPAPEQDAKPGENTQDEWDNSQAYKEGWGVFDTNRGPYIQRDDELRVFEFDEDAVAFVKGKAKEGSAYHIRALEIAEAAA
jgi:hypothetical protein